MHGSGYNFLSRLTHRLALQYPAFAQASFDLETLRYPLKEQHITKPVFISGLARSGTTILLQYLYDTGEFGALTYRDMPFVLMPNTWRKLSRQHNDYKPSERAHRDGILINQDSPEAFEEVFWRIFCGREYILKDRLIQHQITFEVSQKFKNYISHVSASNGSKRYLSKNNNNILRLGYLQKAFPDSAIIVPFRQPLQHAISLLEQHKLFCKLQEADKFTLSYMNWLGHFEFGLGQKPFFFGDQPLFAEMGNYPQTDINFWLLTWKNYYRYLTGQSVDNLVLFDYDAFCAAPGAMLSGLFRRLAIENQVPAPPAFKLGTRNADNINPAILDDCESIYAELKKNAAGQQS